MANVSVYNIEGKEVGTIDLSDAVFGVEVNEHLVHMAVVSQLANNRQGTQKAKIGRASCRERGALKCPAAEENHGDRKERATQDRDLQGLLSGQAAELYLLRCRETIPLR